MLLPSGCFLGAAGLESVGGIDPRVWVELGGMEEPLLWQLLLLLLEPKGNSA